MHMYLYDCKLVRSNIRLENEFNEFNNLLHCVGRELCCNNRKEEEFIEIYRHNEKQKETFQYSRSLNL